MPDLAAPPTICASGLYHPPLKADGKTLEKGELVPWHHNAELIARGVVPLGFLQADWRTLDPTYGKGNWWNDWRPTDLVTHDIEADGVDFRQLPHDDDEFAAVAFDPPYVAVGGLETSTMQEFHSNYGLSVGGKEVESERLFSNPDELHDMNASGLAEVARVTAPGGLVLLKTANYVWSGKMNLGAHLMVEEALNLGLKPVDSFVMAGVPRPQPARTRKCGACAGSGLALLGTNGAVTEGNCDACAGSGRVKSPVQHARQNLSYLYVFSVPKVRRRKHPKLPLV